MRGNLVWDICTFVPSKAALTKEVVFHKSGLSKRYYCISDLLYREKVFWDLLCGAVVLLLEYLLSEIPLYFEVPAQKLVVPRNIYSYFL